MVKAFVMFPISIDVNTRPANIQNIANKRARKDLGLLSPYLKNRHKIFIFFFGSGDGGD